MQERGFKFLLSMSFSWEKKYCDVWIQKWAKMMDTYVPRGATSTTPLGQLQVFKERENYKNHCLFSLSQAWFKNCKHFFPVICSLIKDLFSVTIDLYISRNCCNYNANQYNTHCINSRILFENYLTLFIKKAYNFHKADEGGLTFG